MNTRKLQKALKEIKKEVPIDYVLNRGYNSPSYMIKYLAKTY